MANNVAAAAAMVLILLCVSSASCMARVGRLDQRNFDWGRLRYTNYGAWTRRQQPFYVGDTLVFKYDKRFDSVLQVTEEHKWECITSNPIATYNSGSDAPGDYYFISGVSDRCWGLPWGAMQKMHVFVNPIPPAPPSMSVSPAPNTASNSTGSNNRLSYILLRAASTISPTFAAAVADSLSSS